MTLEDNVNALFHTPEAKVYIDAVEIDTPLRLSVDLGYDIVSAAATLTMAEVPAGLDFRQTVSIELGYDGITQAVFGGFIEDDGRQYFPFDNELKCAGRLKAAQYPYPSEVTHTGRTDTFIIEDLLSKVNISAVNLAGDPTVTYGNVQAVTLKRGSEPWSIINEIDQVSGYATFDLASGVYRRRVAGAPDISQSVWAYVQGTNILRISRPRTIRQIHNKVIVTGLSLGGSTTVSSTWQGANSNIPNPPEYITYNFRSSLIESAAHASAVAERLLSEQNRVGEVIELEVPGNPIVQPGHIITLSAPKIGISGTEAFWVRHVNHSFAPDGFVTRLTVEGGALATGGAEVEVVGEEPTDISYPDPSTPSSFGGGGRPYATFVIAASDSTATGASSADYVCDGEADEEQIESALNACEDGGRVLLLEGTYIFSSSIAGQTVDGITLEGQGMGTVLKMKDGAGINTAMIFWTSLNNCRIANLKIDCNATNNVGNSIRGISWDTLTHSTIENVWITDASGIGIWLDVNCTHIRVHGCRVDTVSGANQGIYVQDGANVEIDGCQVQDAGDDGIGLYDCTYSKVANCSAESNAQDGISVLGGVGNVVAGNTTTGQTGYGIRVGVGTANAQAAVTGNASVGDGGGIAIDGGDNCAVTGNHCSGATGAQDGISVAGDGNAIVGNVCEGNTGHGIELANATNCVVAQNVCTGNSQQTDATYDGIYVTGDDNMVKDNVVRHGGGAKQHGYGIQVASGTANWVTDNDLRNSGTTGSFSDSGTSTVTSSAGNQT